MSSLIGNVLQARPPLIERGQGVWLFDTDGKAYLDGSSGAVVTAIGHAHPKVLAAMAAQAQSVTFTHRGAFTSLAAETLADRLCQLTGYQGAWLVNSGSEAVEAALQFALQYHRERGDAGRQLFLSQDRSYHGSTLGGLSLSGHGRRTVAAGLAYDFPVLPTPGPAADDAAVSELLQAARLEFQAAGDWLAAVFVEPVGGATLGANPLPLAYLRGLRDLCEEFGALFVTDEVMSGLGRTGFVLALDAAAIRSDIAVVGKGLGAGYTPVAATLLSQRVLGPIAAGSGRILGGHTYAANPLSAAVGLAVLDVMAEEAIIDNVHRTAPVLERGLRDLAERHALVTHVRGRGLLFGVELDTGTRPLGSTAQAVAAAAMAHGLIVYTTTGGFNDAFLVAPPLISTVEEILMLIDRLDAALTAAAAAPSIAAAPQEAPVTVR